MVTHKVVARVQHGLKAAPKPAPPPRADGDEDADGEDDEAAEDEAVNSVER
jgi:hypothetical protein